MPVKKKRKVAAKKKSVKKTVKKTTKKKAPQLTKHPPTSHALSESR